MIAEPTTKCVKQPKQATTVPQNWALPSKFYTYSAPAPTETNSVKGFYLNQPFGGSTAAQVVCAMVNLVGLMVESFCATERVFLGK